MRDIINILNKIYKVLIFIAIITVANWILNCSLLLNSI